MPNQKYANILERWGIPNKLNTSEFLGVEYCREKLRRTKNKKAQLFYLSRLRHVYRAITPKEQEKYDDLRDQTPNWEMMIDDWERKVWTECMAEEREFYEYCEGHNL